MWMGIMVAWAAPADLAAELVDLDNDALLARLAEEMGASSGDPAAVVRLTDAMGIAKALAEADLPPAARRAVVVAMVSDDPDDRAWAKEQVATPAAPTAAPAVPPELSEAYEARRLVLGPIQRTQTTVTGSWAVTSSWQDWTVYEGGYRALNGKEVAEILGDDEMLSTIQGANRRWKTAGTVSFVGGGAAVGAGVILLSRSIGELDTGGEFWAGTGLTAGGAGAVTFGIIALLTNSFKHRYASLAYKKKVDSLQEQIETYNAGVREELGMPSAE